MTTDADPFEEERRAARKNIRPKPIRIATAARNIRCGLPGKLLAFVPRENRFPLFRIIP
jgi:hypothetical protein